MTMRIQLNALRRLQWQTLSSIQHTTTTSGDRGCYRSTGEEWFTPCLILSVVDFVLLSLVGGLAVVPGYVFVPLFHCTASLRSIPSVGSPFSAFSFSTHFSLPVRVSFLPVN